MRETTATAAITRGNVRGERARQKLLLAALDAFAARGFHGVSTRDIAQAAGMSPAAMYTHYKTKEALLFELSLRGHSEIQAIVASASSPTQAPLDQLKQVVRDYVSWHAREHITARVVQYEMNALLPEHHEHIASIRRDIERRVRTIVRRGIRGGCFNAQDPKITSLAILSLGVDVARWYQEDGKWTPDYIAETYTKLALQMVGCSANPDSV